MKNLGKIVLFLLLTQYTVAASVKATVDFKSVEVGEMVTYSLYISGEDVVRPNIQTLCGVDVISTTSQTNIEMINGRISRANILSYKFIPQKDCTIEPIEIEIDGKVQMSNAIDIKVGAVIPNKDSDFILSLSTLKKEVYVGEPFDVILLFKQRDGAEAVDNKFIPPELKGFWIKGESKPQRSKDGKYTVTKIVYTMAAQRVGDLDITKAQMRIASRKNVRDSWGSFIPRIKWKSYFSNDLSIKAKALPGGVDLVGNFSILASVDAKEINSNEAVNLTIEVLGNGNLEDIKSFKPYIQGVNIFDEDIAIRGNKLTQKIAFVGENDFIIEPFILKYFDTDTKEIKTISTNEISIKVKNAKPKEELTIKREQKPVEAKVEVAQNSLSNLWIGVIFVSGLVVGMLLMLLKPLKFKAKEKAVSIKEPKLLLVKLFPYKDDEEVQKIIDILEENIYSGAKMDIDKKALKEIIKKYSIS